MPLVKISRDLTKIEQNTPWFAISLSMIDKGETADNGVCIKNKKNLKIKV